MTEKCTSANTHQVCIYFYRVPKPSDTLCEPLRPQVFGGRWWGTLWEKGCFHFFWTLSCQLNFLFNYQSHIESSRNKPLVSGETSRPREFAAEPPWGRSAALRWASWTPHRLRSILKDAVATCNQFLIYWVTGSKREHSPNRELCNPKGIFSLGMEYNLHFLCYCIILLIPLDLS